MGAALLLYPNQLFEPQLLPKVDRIYLVEEPLFFGTDKEFPNLLHRQKLVLQRASMRRYAEEVLWKLGVDVTYLECASELVSETALVKAAFEGASEVIVFDPIDARLMGRLEEAARALEVHVPLKKLESPSFYLKTTDVSKYFSDTENHGFNEFYQWQRERFNVLIDDSYKPYGGKWMYETVRKTKPDVTPSGVRSFGDNDFVTEAIAYVEKHFPHNPGELANFIWPTNHDEAKVWLDDFFANRLREYAAYSDVIEKDAIWLFHSALSPLLNSGFLSNKQVVESVLDYAATSKKEVPIDSLENFVRGVIGWREYVRALYSAKGESFRSYNPLGNARLMTGDWYQGTTGLAPFDDLVAKLLKYGYAHNIERSAIAGNLMQIADITPANIYTWFMSMFIDAYDWAVLPQVALLSGSHNEKPGTLPQIYPSDYIMQISNYQKSQWCDVWDGLYWRFVDQRRLMINKVARSGPALVKRYDHLEPSRKRIIGYRAQDFIDACTNIQT